MEYASNGKSNLGVTLGAIGTGLGLLNNNGILGNVLGGNNCNNNYVDKDTLDLQLRLVESQKDNAILTSELSSEKKMVEVFNATNDKIMNVRDELSAAIRAVDNKVDANTATQAVINAQYGSQINLNTSQLAQLFAMTKMVIPNTSVCPGWGNVTINPTIATTGTTTT